MCRSWQPFGPTGDLAKHFGMAVGFAGILHFQIADSILDTTPYKKTLTISQTLYGPILGFGIYF